jgi:ketosteroid isomerase-like protein
MDLPVEVLVRDLYEARARGDLRAVREMLAEDVRWHEPELGEHTGDLRGAEAMLGMIHEAQRRTGGTFRLTVREAIQHGEQVVALVDWSSVSGGEVLEGREIAIYRVRDGRVTEAWFHPNNLNDDERFWSS